jgi:hypothetical protein
VLAGAALACAACGGGPDENQATTAPPTTTAPEVTPSAPAATSTLPASPAITPAQRTLEPATTPSTVADETFICSLVIGHSQTNQWFALGGTFEVAVGDANWQLLWQNGATVNLWSRDRFGGWERPVQSPCEQQSEAPDRIIFQVGGVPGSDAAEIAGLLRRAITNIQERYPSAREIVLFPTITGPGGQACYIDGELVTASQSHITIAPAIEQVLGPGIRGGFTPEVRSCDDYADSTGHLTREAAAAAGTLIATFFLSR